MEPAAILVQLAKTQDLPRDALRAATQRRAQMVPLFLAEIERYLAAEASERARETPLFFIFHLLGEWQETSAYRPLARLLRCHPDDIDETLGEAITETAHRVMTAVYDGDPEPIYNIILDENADEYVRSGMCEVLAMLVVQGRLDRVEASSFLRDCWASLRPRHACFVWQGWQSAIAMLGLIELKDIVKEAFDRGYVHAGWLRYHHFERDLEHAAANPTEPWPKHGDQYAPFGDTIEELAGWYALSEESQARRKQFNDEPSLRISEGAPLRNPRRDIGRNDPCPCGSGKKFKKCCLN